MPELESRTYSIRLKNEHDNVMKLNHSGNKLFTIAATPSISVPYSQYDLTYNGETWVLRDGKPARQKGLKMRITLYRDFPYSAPYCEVIDGSPVPYHVNWWQRGYVCNGVAWTVSSHLDEYVRFVIEVLQFKSERINPYSAANHAAKDWWIEHRYDNSYFPTDNSPWPGERAAYKIRIV